MAGTDPRPGADWAVIVEGRSDPAAIIMLVDDHAEAESIAGEIRCRGTAVVVRHYQSTSERAQEVPGPARPVMLL